MNRNILYELIIDSLCGEISREQEKKLQLALDSDELLANKAKELEEIWNDLGQICFEPNQKQQTLDRVFRKIVASQDDELLDEELDKAAGGLTDHGKNGYKK